jgi:hypothetical protein
MKPEGQGYLLREYGSWSVLIVAFFTGLGVSKAFPWQSVPLLLALGLLINSKQAYTRWLRSKGDRRPLVIFLLQVAAAAVVLLALFRGNLPQLLPLLVIPAAYLIMNRFAGEHHILTELLGFALLSLAAVLAKFLVVQGVDVRLYAAAALYFTAGVFKVKAVLFKRTSDRILAVCSIVFVAVVYLRFHIALIILLPLVENILMATTLYKVRLQTTGWIEVGKSLAFLGLMIAFF